MRVTETNVPIMQVAKTRISASPSFLVQNATVLCETVAMLMTALVGSGERSSMQQSKGVASRYESTPSLFPEGFGGVRFDELHLIVYP